MTCYLENGTFNTDKYNVRICTYSPRLGMLALATLLIIYVFFNEAVSHYLKRVAEVRVRERVAVEIRHFNAELPLQCRQ